MAHAEHDFDFDRANADERLHLGERGAPIFGIAAAVGALGLVVAIVLGFVHPDGFRRFYFAYLVAYTFFLSISVGSLGFVLLQHISRAGWSVSVRRVAETLAGVLPVLAVLSLPLLVSVMQNNGILYRWAQPVSEHGHVEHHDSAPQATDHATDQAHDEAAGEGEVAESAPHAAVDLSHAPALHGIGSEKRTWLNPPFFVLRVLVYLIFLSGVAVWYRSTSIRQDESGDVALTLRMQRRSAPMILLSGIAVTFLVFDIVMSLDPAWYSTIFGIYYMAGALIAAFASIILVCRALQAGGWLTRSVSREHYHDLGKFLFGFVFFWGYIAYSQYMLLWYANIPDTTEWFARRGATTVAEDQNPFTVMSIILLVCHLLIPFAGLLSRHVKRHGFGLPFWAIWMLVVHYLDLHWLIMPEMSAGLEDRSLVQLNLGLMELATLVGIGGVFVATFVKLAGAHALRPARDPRLHEALVFHNI